MGEQEEAMNVQRLIELTPRARYVLRGTLDAPLEADVAAGRAQLWEINDGESFAVTRLEGAPGMPLHELVVCAYAGRDVRAFAAMVVESARRQGVPSIRWHTRRPALARMLTAYRPELAEYVFRVEVPAGARAAA